MRLQRPSGAGTDEELIARTNQGDEAAFEVLYYRYRDWVVSLAVRTRGDEDLSRAHRSDRLGLWALERIVRPAIAVLEAAALGQDLDAAPGDGERIALRLRLT
jgi:hypothetical protein